MEIEQIMRLKKFFDIMDTQGKEAAIQYVEEVTGEPIERTDPDAQRPRLQVVDEAFD